MRILIAAKYKPNGRNQIGGVQSWSRAIGDAFKEHQVHFWEHGDRTPRDRYDFGILAHWKHTGKLARLCHSFVNVSHGIIDTEQPSNFNVVFTSEGVRDFWKQPGQILRQPIDLSFWRPHDVVLHRPYLTRFSYRNGLDLVRDVAASLGLEYYHARDLAPEDVRNVLWRSRCVLASGRAALEAAACGVPVVICDDRHQYQGPLLDIDLIGAMEQNYSGRGGVTPTSENVTAAVLKSISEGSLRSHAEEHHNNVEIAERLLELAR